MPRLQRFPTGIKRGAQLAADQVEVDGADPIWFGCQLEIVIDVTTGLTLATAVRSADRRPSTTESQSRTRPVTQRETR
jgi:hypothetical protein